MSKQLKCSLMLILTSFIWGVAFVSQSEGGDALGALSFNCVRSFIAAGVLIPAIRFLDKRGFSKAPETKEEKKKLWVAGICCGLTLFIASNLQQLGITLGTPVGKAGFLTACYIILVPILQIFLHKKVSFKVIIAVILTVIGLYFLCINGSFTLQLSDSLIIICALFFALQIICIDYFVKDCDAARMSCIQFLVTGILTLPFMFIFEVKDVHVWLSNFASQSAFIALFYSSVFSSCIAYTLQIFGQEGVEPAVASLLMSLESVFSVLAGWILLHQVLSVKEMLGCLLIFIAVTLAQLPGKKEMS